MRLLLLCITVLLMMSSAELQAQRTYDIKIYKTLSDFLGDRYTESKAKRKNLFMPPKEAWGDEITNNVLFFLPGDKKLKKTFAVRCGDELYFQVRSILKNLAKGDKVQTMNNPHSYVRVVGQGKYYYMETVSANAWGQGLASNFGAYGAADRLTGLILMPTLGKFNIFRNCKDFNKFILATYPNHGDIGCTSKKIHVGDVREILAEVEPSMVYRK